MRILYDHQIFSIQKFGGISRIFIELMKELSPIPECTIDWYRGFHKDAYNIEYFRNNLKRYWSFSRDNFKFPKLNYDSLNRLTFKAFTLTASSKYNIYHPSYYDDSLLSSVKTQKIAITIYDMILEKYLVNLERFQSVIKGKRKLAERADLIFVISQNTKKDLLEIFDVDPAKIVITYCASRIREIKAQKLPDICYQKPYFLFVGTRSKYKNFEILIKAFAASSWLKSNFNVICFGGTSDFIEPELKNLEEHDLKQIFIYLTGDDRLLKALYQQARALVYTSRYEGFGLPPLEAMECECPVICCPNSSIPEVVGEAALFFAPDSEEELINCMKMIVENTDKRAFAIAEGQERAELFSWEKTARATLEGYQKIL
jgi:glycosyltransferase involved in cell wall biosynthesis